MIEFTSEKTTVEKIKHTIQNGTYFFHSESEDGEPDFYYKLIVAPHKNENLTKLSQILMEKVGIMSDRLSIFRLEDSDYALPYYIEQLFSGKEKRIDISEEEYLTIKNKVLSSL